MRRGSVLLATFILQLATSVGAEPFPRPATLEPQVRFWRAVFADYSRHQVVVHDTLDLDKIYSVLDYRAQADDLTEGQMDRLLRDQSEAEVARIRALLRRFQETGASADLTADEKRIYDLYASDPSPRKFEDAIERVRSQRGLRERFAHGIRIAHGYLPEMEAIFVDEGLPVELTRLPLVESCFNVEAYSKVGAAGIWQFMPATGRLYAMDVNTLVDERRDPIASTRGAARFLRHNFEMLEEQWPLAITAYNHGPAGIRRAIQETGSTDIGVIVERYRGPAFKFASRNFYAEFLAALDVERDHRAYFGDLQYLKRPPSRVVPLDRSVGIELAARFAGTDRDTLAELNPALMDEVVSGRRAIPVGYALRVPTTGTVGFEERLTEFSAEQRVLRVSAPGAPQGRRSRGVVSTHRVARGDTLSEIAQRYGVSVTSLRAANGLKGTVVRRGQVLKIPHGT